VCSFSAVKRYWYTDLDRDTKSLGMATWIFKMIFHFDIFKIKNENRFLFHFKSHFYKYKY